MNVGRATTRQWALCRSGGLNSEFDPAEPFDPLSAGSGFDREPVERSKGGIAGDRDRLLEVTPQGIRN